MTVGWAAAGLGAIVGTILFVSRRPALRWVFRWLPVPLWCYLLPMAAVACRWLPAGSATYRLLTDALLPFALVLLMLGVDLVAVLRSGGQAVLAAAIGAGGIILGASFGVRLLHAYLPSEAWKGAGALAATWTGGTMNLLATRSILQIPDAVFAPLIIVDALVAYSWMALLVAASGRQLFINRWLRATGTGVVGPSERSRRSPTPPQATRRLSALTISTILAVVLSVLGSACASRLPPTRFVNSQMGWTILLITTAALGLALIPAVRRIGSAGERLGYAGLYLVLAATGAQARVDALWSAPLWLVLGYGIALFHGLVLLLAGRWLRIPLGLLATASQANIGGVVSAPMVGAMYEQSLVPVGLLLAMGFNALGTYFGLFAASLCRWLVGS